MLDFMAIKGTTAEVISALERYRGMDATFDQGLDALTPVTRNRADIGLPEAEVAGAQTIDRKSHLSSAL